MQWHSVTQVFPDKKSSYHCKPVCHCAGLCQNRYPTPGQQPAKIQRDFPSHVPARLCHLLLHHGVLWINLFGHLSLFCALPQRLHAPGTSQVPTCLHKYFHTFLTWLKCALSIFQTWFSLNYEIAGGDCWRNTAQVWSWKLETMSRLRNSNEQPPSFLTIKRDVPCTHL